jgi:membrane protease subunit HflC
MISEREQIAELFRSEGAAGAARILGDKELELKTIQSEAYKTIQTIRGEADAKATEIYASAYNQSTEASDFYEFIKTMETYPKVLGSDTTVILSTDSDLFKFLKGMDVSSESKPVADPFQ